MIPSIFSLGNIFFDEDECIKFLFQMEILYNDPSCSECGSSTKRFGKLFRCRKKKCRKGVSIFKDSFFAKNKIPVNKALLIGYLWLTNASHTSILIMTGHSSATITDYVGYYRSLVGSCVQDRDNRKIGGEDIIVEIDESKFGKRKNYRGHRVEGVWVVGGVERTVERKVFVQAVSVRSSEMLLNVVEENVLPGSIIYTDMWRGYSAIKAELGLQHLTVNHSETFVDPDTGVHTNTIEGTWNGIKYHVSPRNRTKSNISNHLFEFIWRRENQDHLWESLLKCMRETGYFE